MAGSQSEGALNVMACNIYVSLSHTRPLLHMFWCHKKQQCMTSVAHTLDNTQAHTPAPHRCAYIFYSIFYNLITAQYRPKNK